MPEEKSHMGSGDYFIESVKKKFINQGKIPDKNEHEKIMGNFRVRKGELVIWHDYIKIAGIRILEGFVQDIIDKGEIPSKKQQGPLLNLFEKVRESLDEYKEKNPGLEQDYDKVSNDYLTFLETKRKEEEAAETAYSLIEPNQIEPNQKEESIEDLIKSGKIPTEEEVNQQKGKLDGMVENKRVKHNREERISSGSLWDAYSDYDFEVTEDQGPMIYGVWKLSGITIGEEVGLTRKDFWKKVKEKISEKEVKNE